MQAFFCKMEFLCGTYTEDHGNLWDRLGSSKTSKLSLDLDSLNNLDGFDVSDAFDDYTGHF